MSTLIILGSTERTKCITTKEGLREDMEVDTSTQNILHMNSGVGDKSYAHNSFFQRKAIIQAKPILEESITRLYHNNIVPKCLKVADLGCSSGPNALQVVSNIINIVDTTSSNLNLTSPNFQFYLNDLFENDFNTIFKSLPQYHKTLLEEKKELKIGSCFINATPGTFYNRLFPTSSIHFFHSSYCLHWLSQVPEKLIEGEEALRWDNIYLTRTSPVSMHKAYLEQFQKDFKQFLKSRSEELVTGGGMLLAFIGRQDTSEIRTAWELIDMSLKDLLLEKLIEKETLECFNMPNYDPSMEEVKQVIEEEGSFILQKLETVHQDWDPNTNGGGNDKNKVDENMRGEILAKYIRAITEPLLKAHFGELRMDELFLRLENKAVQLIKEIKIFKFPILVISLIKNA
ncbi:7-methylxanthosine synthase 1-like [Arachis stenosperma]|uniref:7-methylxanthosine synthase 1-like n=1 Tax=Arachis stenosperma TaxID=217475 RepID=UPI0025AC411B|nr:7-methylxanthosine synthase 1-like [Arachis stenosperma]